MVLYILGYPIVFFFFFFNDTATTEIYTLSLHDALPICRTRVKYCQEPGEFQGLLEVRAEIRKLKPSADRKSTRLNSSHSQISYAVFCLKKKKQSIEIPYAVITDNYPH